MKRPVFLCLFMAVGMAGVFAAGALRVEGESVWDFGQVKAGRVVSNKFILKNSGSQTVKIERTDTSCGCTVGKISRIKLEPFDEAKVEVSFNSSGYQGKVEQKIFVRTDEAENPVVELMIKADVIK